MDRKSEDVDVYRLVTDLCENLVEKNTPEEHPCLPRKDKSGFVKKLRIRAFEILLNKSRKIDDHDHRRVADPVVEMLKFSFELKTRHGRCSQAEKLESLLESFGDERVEDGVADVRAALKFLEGSKSLEPSENDGDVLEVFHYGRANPLLPEELQECDTVPRFQIYPMEAFVVPERFEAMLGIRCSADGPIAVERRDSCGSISFGSRYRSAATIGIESLGSDDTTGSVFSAPRYDARLSSTREFSTSSFFLPRISEDELLPLDEYSEGLCSASLAESVDPPWIVDAEDADSDSGTSDARVTMIDLTEGVERVDALALDSWANVVVDFETISEHRTWETLGPWEARKEPPFVTEKPEAMFHFETISQTGFVPLLPRAIVEKMIKIRQVPTKELMEGIKLLLVGVESEYFTWDDERRVFVMRKNITISGLGVEALASVCSEAMHWGACYRVLSLLVKSDSSTIRRPQEGLIFQAMSNSAREILIHYEAATLRLSAEKDDAAALLKLMRYARPLGDLVAEVARLCRCDRPNNAALGEGLGLLSHVYEQVTLITKPKIALVFYSILKSCCEVYFRMLQRWLFEGSCEDLYGEFMIRTRPQFLHERTRRFWNKAFAISNGSVPGFLAHLVDSILECGKTVRLLKICDPKNPLCALLATRRPTVRVCLSVGMVREQEIVCREYFEAGDAELGENSSFSYAFEEKRRDEKARADLVIAAQRGTLRRIKHEHEEAKLELIRHKRELLAELKDQAEEAASRKERERVAELVKDKQYLEDINAAEESAKNVQLAEKKNLVDYYNELAAEAEKRRARADWRVRRMKLYEQRADYINEPVDNDFAVSSEKKDSTTEENADPCRGENQNTQVERAFDLEDENENRNPTESNEIVEGNRKTDGKAKPTKSPRRPCVLEIDKTKITTSGKVVTNLNELRESHDENTDTESNRPRGIRPKSADDDAKTIAQRNKLKVWQQEYGMTPNNNEFNIIVMDAEGNESTICIDATTVVPDNLRKIRDIDTERNENRNRNMAHRTGESDEFVTANRNSEMISTTMSDAQRNRKRNMTETYRDAPVEISRVADSAELQRNRARVMGHDNRDYRDCYVAAEDIGADCLDPPTPMSQSAPGDDGVTPMSCTTDTFPTSSLCGSFIHEEASTCGGAPRRAITPGDPNLEDLSEETRSISSSRGGFDLPRGEQAFPNFFGREAADEAPTNFQSSLTIADVEMIDNTSLQAYLEKSVTIPLRIQSRLANAAIVKHFIYEEKMLSHLHSLRSYFFLLNGEFARSLTSSIYKRLYEISAPIELFQPATLTNLVKNALNNSLSSTYENSECLSLSAMNIPSRLELSNPEFLNCLCLNYQISWPLNIILDEKVMSQYRKVFKFLVMVGRVLYVLQEDFHLLKVERKAATSDQYHKLQLYRHSMMQFITAFHNYLTCSVLHASWTEFEKDLESATTLDRINFIHVAYVKRILSRCMLTTRGEGMHTFLCSIFRVILKFHNRVRSQSWSRIDGGYTHANFERLEEMYRTFCESRTYFAHVADKLALSGYQPHLTHFINALNINSQYDLSHSNISKKS